MKVIYYIGGMLTGLVLLVFLSQLVASETGEVVVLGSRGEDGIVETRLWVVDLNGHQYLRASPDSGWYQRLLADPLVRLERQGEVAGYRALPHRELADAINTLMREKYGWRDAYIEVLFGGFGDRVPFELIPAS